MKLQEYAKKRDFDRTPEPEAGKDAVKEKNLPRFVVQKHNASHLHYDLRLENEGVLKSWAVPKGISLDPNDKRLAIQVEDHPYEYRNFEGAIPEGNYGAGSVIIWDEGTYSTNGDSNRYDIERSVKAALEKGHLDVRFKGKKLNGLFTMVRMRNKDNDWLIIKKKDEYAGSNEPVDERSVRTGKAVFDIPARDPELEKSLPGSEFFKGAVKAALPEEIKPMLATLIDEPFDNDSWIYEVKWDGYRAIAQIKKGDVRLYSRNNNTLNNSFPSIVKGLSGLGFDAVFDGEIVAIDSKGRVDFQMLQNYLQGIEGKIAYYVFDVIYAGNYDLRGLPLIRRKAILEKILPVSESIRLSDYIQKKGNVFYRVAQENGLEGIIAKKSDSRYAERRTKDWLKVKIQKRQEAVICGYTKGRESRKYFGALILGVYKEDQLSYLGHVGTGFDDKTLKYVYQKIKPLQTAQCPFSIKPKTNTPVTWVSPKLLCEVKFSELTQEGIMRHPVFLGLREDKADKDIKEIKTKAVLTHLNKIFWPKEGYTKKDLIEYYWSVSDWILPYLIDRPQSLNRQPDGIMDKGFFQKDMDGLPPQWAKTIRVRSESGDKEINYLLCQDKDTLLYLVNLGCIEINVWNSVVSHLDKPDYVVLDFDPVEVTFKSVVQAVLATKKILDELGLPSFCKTSGSKGIHIYIPVRPNYNYDQAKNFAHLINILVKQRNPGFMSLERSPNKRRGLVYLDYLQNRYGATMAAPYSVRPREGAPVSTPLEWDEVTEKLDPLSFNIKTLPKRLGSVGDIWKDMFKQRIDLEESLSRLEKSIQDRKARILT